MDCDYVKLGLDSDYSKFLDFECSYKGIPDYAKDDIRSLSEYLSHEKGARYDFEKGFGVTRVAYRDGKPVGYFTLMSGSIFYERLGTDLADTFSFHCLTYPALKISRFAVDKRYQGERDEAGWRISEYMLSRIFAIGTSLSNHIGVRYIITDALGIYKTLRFYRDNGFRPFNGRDMKKIPYETTFNSILSGNYKKPEDEEHVGVPLYTKLH
jgi:GNAT superfamily N-acetyltransferase